MSTENLTTMTVDSEFALTEARPAKKYALRQPGMSQTEKNALISARIMYLAESRGITLTEAVDLVLGTGTVDALIDSVYRSFRTCNASAVACGASEGHE